MYNSVTFSLMANTAFQAGYINNIIILQIVYIDKDI